ncbi:MAG: type II-A CRISPR-associated protein Csn2 [Clostridia bacterium]|nr:type II-A CRISPR-associated protein Csn2 [Clostridia bacterium]
MKSEIKITHANIETPLIVSDEFVQLLIIENPSFFYSTVCDLNNQFEGELGNYIFSTNNQMIPPAKNGDIISNLFNFDLNDKKNLTLLQKKLESIAFSEKIINFNELSSKTIEFVAEVSCLLPFTLEYNEPQPSDYFKIAGVKFEKQYDSLEEKIICYINALIELKKCEFFIFINLKSVLSDEKLKQIYSHCRAEQIGLLLVESGKLRPLLTEEKAIIITEDLCEIVENYN